MKKYRVVVNGNEYEIEIEEIAGGAASSAPRRAYAPAPARPAAPKAPAPAPKPLKPAAAPAPAPAAPAAAAPAGGTQITAPMPGNINAVKVSNGQAVKKGDVVFILEAMKMENEIMAPCDGTVQSVSVTAGTAVTSGALLCVIQ